MVTVGVRHYRAPDTRPEQRNPERPTVIGGEEERVIQSHIAAHAARQVLLGNANTGRF